MAATLKQVAQAAGVSYQTVWRAVHGYPGILPTTRDKILRSVAQLGYRPNRVAGSLRTKRTETLGLVVFDVSNTYTAQLISGIESEAGKRGYSVLLMSTGNDFNRERAAILSLLERGVDGLIVTGVSQGDHRYLRRELPDRVPLVALSHSISGIQAPTVAARNRDAGVIAAEYLVKLGHKDVGGIFGDLGFGSLRERYDGFTQSLKKEKVPVRKNWIISGANKVEFAREAIRKIFNGPKRPAAFFASTHQLTEGALLGLNDIGLRHGHGVVMVGFDIRYAQLLDPPLPVLLQPGFELGELAVAVLADLIAGNVVSQPDELSVRFHAP